MSRVRARVLRSTALPQQQLVKHADQFYPTNVCMHVSPQSLSVCMKMSVCQRISSDWRKRGSAFGGVSSHRMEHAVQCSVVLAPSLLFGVWTEAGDTRPENKSCQSFVVPVLMPTDVLGNKNLNQLCKQCRLKSKSCNLINTQQSCLYLASPSPACPRVHALPVILHSPLSRTRVFLTSTPDTPVIGMQ